MSIHCSIALKIYPSLQYYSDNTGFTSLICTDDNDDYVPRPSENVEWLSPNFTLLMSSSDYRIHGINIILNIVVYRSANYR